MMLYAEEHSHVNVTVKALIYTGREDNSSCLFAGVATFDGLSDHEYEPKETVCTTYSGWYMYKHKPILSQSHRMLLILYAFQQYATLGVTLVLSSTRCLPLRQNLCDNSYRFQHVFKFLRPEGGQSPLTADGLLPVPTNSCMVLELSSDPDLTESAASLFPGRHRLCNLLQFRHTNVQHDNRVFKYTVSGYMGGKYQYTLSGYMGGSGRTQSVNLRSFVGKILL